MIRGYSFGIAVFPQGGVEEQEEMHRYIQEAAALGCREVFTSLHIPELDASEALRAQAELAGFVHDLQMQFSADISGKMAAAFLHDQTRLQTLRRMQLDWIRMDFGFQPTEMLRLTEEAAPRGLMLNASVLDPGQLARQVALLQGACPHLRLRGHHNYYPMPETGLSLEFMVRRSAQYWPYGLPVTACVASHHRPRLPLKKGLPTVEAHRALPPGQAAMQLLDTGVVDDVLIGDPFATPQELLEVALACGCVEPTLRIRCTSEITPQERAAVFEQRHVARPDEAAFAIRSQSSREMAAQGPAVRPRPCGSRKRGDILVVNANALRYSGEVQIMRCDQPGENWHNPIGTIIAEDLWMLELLRPGASFRLVGEEK